MKSENQHVMLTNESLDWKERAWANTCLICPVCNYEYVALQRVEVVAPGMPEGKLTVDSKGIHCVPKKVVTRGSVVSLYYECERGHRWQSEMTFHEGVTMFSMNLIDPPSSPQESNDKPIGPIWRD